MQVQVTGDKEKELTVEITGEDYSIAEIVHHELLDERNVTFAGVLPAHPLIKKVTIKLRTQRVKAEKVLENSVERAINNVRSLFESMKEALAGERR